MTRNVIELPDGVTASIDHTDLTVEGPNGTVTKRLWYPQIEVRVDDDTIVLETTADDAKTRATIRTFESHIQNILHGVTEGWEYEMEVVYAHFPMQVRVEGGEVVIENFVGERAPRRTRIHGDTTVDIDGETVLLSGPDKEAVGQTAADIEQLTRISGKDTRVFQDGVYISRKPVKGGTITHE